ncbi:MAG: SLC13 family permease, partial [Pseudomonadota bacterium]
MPQVSPDIHGIVVLVMTALALFLFTRDQIPLESSSLTILVLLLLLFQLFPYEGPDGRIAAADFFQAFGNEALVAVCALMIVGRGLETTGALQPLAGVVASAWRSKPILAFLATLVAGAVLSAFMNNTPIVVLLLPILVAVSMDTKTAPSRVLIPMGLATIIGGMSTTIGTSTNLLVVGLAREQGLVQFNMFDFTVPVAMVGGVGILFLWLVAPRLMPHRLPPLNDTSPRVFNAQLSIRQDGFAAGKTLSEVLAKTQARMRVDRIQRTDSLFLAKLPSVVLQAGDRLYVKDTPDNLKTFERAIGAELYTPASEEETPLTAAGQQLAEVVVTRGSLLHRRTLSDTNFSSNTKLLPLAVHRARTPSSRITTDLGNVRLRAGDVLLVQGKRSAIENLKTGGAMLVLDGTTDLPHTHRAKRALGIMALVIGLAATGLVPIATGAVAGVGLMLATGCLRWRDITDALSTPIIMIVVTSLALGFALMQTGMAEYVAQRFVALTAELPVPYVLSAFMLIMTVLTNVVSNNAAAVIGTPI